MRHVFLACLLAVATSSTAMAGTLLEPSLHLPKSASSSPRIAVTLDACSGDIDQRILDVLIEKSIPTTLFVTERWLRRNPATIALLNQHPDLFDMEDHGRDHVPAVTGDEKPYGIAPAGTLAGVDDEVQGGANAIALAFGSHPLWFRGATALYTQDALDEITKLGFRVAGFSLNADFGATASAAVAQTRLESASDGDVIIAHINQPKRAAGKGIAAGLLALKARGFQFVRLADLSATAN